VSHASTAAHEKDQRHENSQPSLLHRYPPPNRNFADLLQKGPGLSREKYAKTGQMAITEIAGRNLTC
jgi:hypothetical protein